MPKPLLILVAEDEPLILTVVEDGLKDAGFEVVVVGDGEAAIAKLEAESDAIMALVTDVNLGKGIKGWDVARRARELIPDMPVVYMTANEGPEWTSHGVPNSILVLKPFAVAQIVTAVSNLLNDVGLHRSAGA